MGLQRTDVLLEVSEHALFEQIQTCQMQILSFMTGV